MSKGLSNRDNEWLDDIRAAHELGCEDNRSVNGWYWLLSFLAGGLFWFAVGTVIWALSG